ncbi:MAG: TolC family protein, partial [Gemmatimonadota bacterium]
MWREVVWRWVAAVSVVLVGLIAPRSALGQGADSLSLEAFLTRVRATHPLAQQATEQRRQVAQELRVARGGFDPAISATWDLKRFNGIGYFDEFDARLTVPTPWGLDFKAGWELAAGEIINPERKTPGQGLFSAGVSLPIGPRLVTDERRTALRQAELADQGADADRDLAIARLLQGAAREWGSGGEGEARLRIAEEGVALAAFRLDAVRKRVMAGAGAAIDSVE